tara:strand:- start:214 stop:693 length:480 start_codon:yes stop_codon:yes gene_type:complete
MAHFAQLNENNEVISVFVVSNLTIIDEAGNENEDLGIQFLKSMAGENTIWKQTSYNNNFRKNYAGIGYTYDESRDAFIPPKFFDNWILNEDTCRWSPPILQPELTSEQKFQGYFYDWNQETSIWELSQYPGGQIPPKLLNREYDEILEIAQQELEDESQ